MIKTTQPLQKDVKDTVEIAKNELKQQSKPVVANLARWGYVAKGVIYFLLGVLSMRAMLGAGSASLDSEDALLAIFLQPFGDFLLLAVAVGLAGYVLWRLVQVLTDTERLGASASGIVKRMAYTASGFGYGGLLLVALRLLLGMGLQPEQESAEHWTSIALSLPVGHWLVGLAGAAVFSLGLYQYYLGFSALWKKKFKLDEMSKRARQTVLFVGRLGISARGIVYNMIGIFLIQAAWYRNPERAGGLSDAMLSLALSRWGPWMLGVVATGFMLYGLYSFLAARYYMLSIEED